MQIVIVGAGTVGFELAVQLRRAGHDIAVIESRPERCEEIGEKLDVLVVQGPGSSPRILEAAGLADAEMLLAVTSMDEVNILVCGIAAQFGVRERIARIRSAEFRDPVAKVDLAALGVTQVIDPENIMVRVIDQIARIPDAIEVFSYHEGQIIIARHIMQEGMPVLGKRLTDLVHEVGDNRFLAVALGREKGKTWIPAGDDMLEAGDDVTTIFPRSSLPKYLELLNLTNKIVRKAVVAGDGRTAIQLCRDLSAWVDDVTLVSSNSDHAHIAADRLDRVEVIHGQPTDRDVLGEANVSTTDLFVGAGRETTPNVMSALLASSMGATRVIAVSYEPESNRLFREIGVQHVLSPRRAMAQEIMDIIDRGRRSVELQLRDMDLESVELTAGKNSKITSAPLQKIWMPYKRQAIIGALIHEGEISIPRGNTQVQEGDELIIVVKPKHIHKINGLFKER